jgi:hypothetical protein
MTTPARRWLLPSIAALALVLLTGGAVLAVADAHARSTAAQQVVDELVDFYATEEGYELGARDAVLRSIVADSVANDGPMPSLHTESTGDYVSARYGAFGGVYSFVPLQRPWSARLIVTPIVAGVVLLVTVLLVAASDWAPSRPRTVTS